MRVQHRCIGSSLRLLPLPHSASETGPAGHAYIARETKIKKFTPHRVCRSGLHVLELHLHGALLAVHFNQTIWGKTLLQVLRGENGGRPPASHQLQPECMFFAVPAHAACTCNRVLLIYNDIQSIHRRKPRLPWYIQQKEEEISSRPPFPMHTACMVVTTSQRPGPQQATRIHRQGARTRSGV